MGTRLGFDLPKGCFNVGLTHELFIFECLINNLMDLVKQSGVFLPLYIMTSEKNDEVTQKFFADHNYFGYDKSYIKFFIQDMACAVDFDGSLEYKYGVILNYLFALDKLEEIVNNQLTVHAVEKKIPYINENGELITPTEPNGYKFELLVLDMIHMMDNNLAYEVEREKEFVPIKNLHGTDSVDSARELLEKNGVGL